MNGSGLLLNVSVWLALAFLGHAHHPLARAAFQEATLAHPALAERLRPQPA